MHLANSADADAPIDYVDKEVQKVEEMEVEDDRQLGGGICAVSSIELSEETPEGDTAEAIAQEADIVLERREEKKIRSPKDERPTKKRKRDSHIEESVDCAEMNKRVVLKVLDSLYDEQRMRISARLMDEMLNERCAVECRLDIAIGQPNFDGALRLTMCLQIHNWQERPVSKHRPKKGFRHHRETANNKMSKAHAKNRLHNPSRSL